MTTAKEDSPLLQRLDAQRTQDLLRALQELSDAHGLGIDTAALAAARQPLASQDDQYPEACLHLQALLPRRAAADTQEWPGYEARLRIRHSKSEVKMRPPLPAPFDAWWAKAKQNATAR